MNITGLKDIMQDCNINFLLGSGLSAPYLSTLGKTEKLLTELAMKKGVPSKEKKIIRAFLYKKFFDDVISKNIEILNNSDDVTLVLDNYCRFLKTLNFILLKRKSTILNKQINLFTTNIDIFLEKSLEKKKVEYNDGFSGRFDPLFDLTNFKKSLFKTSLHHDNIFELPVFNLMKIHGSLTWSKRKNEDIAFSSNLDIIKKIRRLEKSANGKFININGEKNITINNLITKARGGILDDSVNDFIEEYEKLRIINPTKEKFRESILNINHYELLRIFSNELEKENTVLFVAGFSFADEHIREVTIRAANSNPTLAIYIFSHLNKIDKGVKEVKEKSKNRNVNICSPAQKDTVYTFETINNLFDDLLKNIDDADAEVNLTPNHHEQ